MSSDVSKSHMDLALPNVLKRLTAFRLAPRVDYAAKVLIVIGIITLVGSAFIQPQLTWASVLLVSFLMVSLGLSGLSMVAFEYLTAAGWSVALRRINEAIAGLLLPGLLGIAAVLILRPSLYAWISEAEGAHPLIGFKAYWLNHANWLTRAAIYAAIWLLFLFAMRWHSRRQDIDGNYSHSRWNVALSAVFMICFALSYWLASVDWVMSLEPHWYSTMYGVYQFAGLLSGGIACAIVMAVLLRKDGRLDGIVRDDHLHDLGKLLLTFTTFWAYIWFSQYMLIWYANIPEETEHFITRTTGLWLPLFYLNVGLNWAIPFLALLPRSGKRDGNFLMLVALVVLVGRVLDMYLLIIPTVSPSTPLSGLAPLGAVLGGLGVSILVLGKALGASALVPLKDPYLEESLHHHV